MKNFLIKLYKKRFLKTCKKDYYFSTKLLNKVNMNTFKTNDFIKDAIYSKKVDLLPLYESQKKDIRKILDRLNELEFSLRDTLLHFQKEFEELYRKFKVEETIEEDKTIIKDKEEKENNKKEEDK